MTRRGSAGTCAVVTVVHRRHDHLRGLLWGLKRQSRPPDVVVVVAMDDPQIDAVVADSDVGGATVVAAPSGTYGLPLAAARNRGGRVARDAGADTVVFLDVDCIPERHTIARYHETVSQRAAATGPDRAPDVFGGGVAYLPPVSHPRLYRHAGVGQRARPNPARPLPPSGLTLETDLTLFWSLSFALSGTDWDRLGGFCEQYEGYGGEDTDFAQVLGSMRGRLWWVGDAVAYHQHHSPQHVSETAAAQIVRNANLFRQRWGWYPMTGWLTTLQDQGLAFCDDDGRWWTSADCR